jgi:hypothetical protein
MGPAIPGSLNVSILGKPQTVVVFLAAADIGPC